MGGGIWALRPYRGISILSPLKSRFQRGDMAAAVREWQKPRRIGPSVARFQLAIPRGGGKSASLRAPEPIGIVDHRDLRHAPKISPMALPRGPSGRGNVGITTRIRNFGDKWHGFWFYFCRRPICGGFAYLVPPRWVLGDDVHIPRNFSRGPTERYGTEKWRKYD